MKLSFNENPAENQKPVRPDQEHLRRSPIHHFPIGRLLLLFIFFAALVAGVYYIVQSRQMRIYGIVSSQTQVVAAPQAGYIRNMPVVEGQRVKKGELLLTFQPHDTSIPLSTSTLHSNPNLPADAMPITKAQYAVEKAKNEVTRLEQLFKEAEKKREVDIEMAQMEMDALLEGSTTEETRRKSDIMRNQIEVQKLEDFLNNKQERVKQIEKLIAMDAAVTDQLNVARHEVRLAQHNLDQARVDLAQAKQASDTADPTERRRLESQLQLAQVKANPYEQLLAQARIDLKVAKQTMERVEQNPDIDLGIGNVTTPPSELPPLNIYAAFDGIITRVQGSAGSLVGSQSTILTASQTDDTWIRVYIRPDHAARLTEGKTIRLYLPGQTKPITGQITQSGGALVQTPDVLQPHLSHQPLSIMTKAKLNTKDNLPTGSVLKIVMD